MPSTLFLQPPSACPSRQPLDVLPTYLAQVLKASTDVLLHSMPACHLTLQLRRAVGLNTNTEVAGKTDDTLLVAVIHRH